MACQLWGIDPDESKNLISVVDDPVKTARRIVNAHPRLHDKLLFLGDKGPTTREEKHHLFFVIGDPAYFSRFGFQDAAASGLGVDFAAPPAPLQVLDLSGSILGRVQGKIRYPQGILSK